MRTLSARILLGFAALTITFAVITATLVDSLGQVENQVLLVGKGYVPLALKSKELANRQDDLKNYLEKQLPEESNVTLAKANIARYRLARDRFVDANRDVLENLEKSIEVDPRQFVKSRPQLEQIEQAVTAVEPLYSEILTAPPLKMFQQDPLLQQLLTAFLLPPLPTDPKREAAGIAYKKLLDEERKIWTLASQLSSMQERNVPHMTSLLQDNEHLLRVRTFYLGISAVLLGLILTISVVITLRPLRRLRDGARRIAAGDYASRIPEKGPTEVSEIAREFNFMGRAVEERERELVRSERLAAVGKMAAMITHEIRNPLSSIGLNTELLEDELGDSKEARELCRAIHREVDRLTAITEEYLAFARLPKPKLAAEPINPLVGALAAFVREDLAAKKITLTTDLAPFDPIAQIDAGQIRQCLINLVRNAAEAVVAKKGSGTITLRTRTVKDRIEIAVIDDGIGIPADVLPRLFDPFFSTKEGGSGLGLALTQQIVRDHGGDLDVSSTAGRGTTFTLTIPMST